MSTVYVKLLEEGTEVFRPVPAIAQSGSRYLLGGQEFFYPDNERWEFPPGSIVEVELKELSGEAVLVAVRLMESDSKIKGMPPTVG